MAQVKHYILVEVIEPEELEDYHVTHMGWIRKSLHKAAEELGVKIADIPFRGDSDLTYYRTRNAYPEVREIFEREMGVAKAAHAKIKEARKNG